MVMMKKMIRVWILFFVVALLVLVCGEAVTIGEKCSNEFTKVSTCLAFATGKSDTPTKECCTSVTEIKQSDPECLCYIIQQTHSGSQQLKSTGIQESRLLQLPSACKLANASVSDCPKRKKERKREEERKRERERKRREVRRSPIVAQPGRRRSPAPSQPSSVAAQPRRGPAPSRCRLCPPPPPPPPPLPPSSASASA